MPYRLPNPPAHLQQYFQLFIETVLAIASLALMLVLLVGFFEGRSLRDSGTNGKRNK